LDEFTASHQLVVLDRASGASYQCSNVTEVDGRSHYTYSGAGEVFSVVRPEMSKEMKRKVREEVRACPAGKDYYKTLGLAPGRRLWYNSHES